MAGSSSERYGGTGSPDDMEREQQRQKLFQEMFGIEHRWEPEVLAPRITDEFRERMRAYVRRELAEDQDVEIVALISRFRSVALCCIEIQEEERRRHTGLSG